MFLIDLAIGRAFLLVTLPPGPFLEVLGPEIQQNNYTYVFGVAWFFDVIIPKWLINDSRSIAIGFGTSLQRPTMLPNLEPRTPHFSPKYFKQYKNISEHP